MKIDSAVWGVGFLTYRPESEGGILWTPVDTIEEAHGVRLVCPCGLHFVTIWTNSADPEARPDVRRMMEGSGLNDLTMLGEPFPSGCGRMVSVTNGEIV